MSHIHLSLFYSKISQIVILDMAFYAQSVVLDEKLIARFKSSLGRQSTWLQSRPLIK